MSVREGANNAEKVEAVAEKTSGVGDSTDEAVEAPPRAVVARPRLLVAMAIAPKPPAEVPWWASAIGVARIVIKGATAQQSYAADAKNGGTLPRPASRPWNLDAVEATDGGTLMMSTPHRKKNLTWRWRVRLGQGTKTKKKVRSRPQIPRPKRQASAVMIRGKSSRLGKYETRPGYAMVVRLLT